MFHAAYSGSKPEIPIVLVQIAEAALIMATLPIALAGGIWLLWGLAHNLAVSSGVGFIALAGVPAEFGVIMLLYFYITLYLKHAWKSG